MEMPAASHHLLEIAELSALQINDLLDDAESRLEAKNSPVPTNIVQVNAFFENSTRTSLSFELAGKRLGLHVLNMVVAHSSVAKGESLLDTAHTLEAMGAHVIVLRHPESGAAATVAAGVGCAVINAGDGTNEHPTQALIDALALRRRFGRLEGLTVAICGDIRHSRVARSNMLLLTRMGARVRVSGPAALLPCEPLPDGAVVMPELDDAIAGADAVMMLRVQRERMAEGIDLSLSDYHARYGLSTTRLKGAAPHAVVMHPGPINRGVEIEGTLADDASRSLILEQVALGVPVRMACLAAVTGAGPRPG